MSFALDGHLAHGDHSVLTWMADHITVRQASAGNIELDEAQSAEKIDGTVALITALDRAIRNGGDEASESVYDERGVLFI